MVMSNETTEERFRKRGFEGSVLTMGAALSVHLLRFGSNLVLTRLLLRESFGLMALVNVFVLGLELLSDLGIRAVVIQNEKGDRREFLDTAFTAQVARGFFLYGIVWLAAEPFAAHYGDPRIAAILPVTGLVAVIDGFISTKFYEANRRLEMRRIVSIQVAAQAISAATLIGWALVSPSVWALVAGGLAHPVTKTVLSHVALRGRTNRFAFDIGSARAMISFGKWIFASTLLTFVVQHSDRLIFGSMMSLEMLGVYSMALMLTRVPAELLIQVSNLVAFPIFSRAAAEKRFARTFEETRTPLLLTGAVLFSITMAGGPTIAAILFPAGYEDAGWMIQILSVFGILCIHESYYRAGILAMGKPSILVTGAVAKLAGMAAFIYLGFVELGIFGAILGYAVSEMLPYLVSGSYCAFRGIGNMRRDALIMLGAIATGFLGRAAAKVCAAAGLPVALEALALGGVVLLLWLPALLPQIGKLASRFRPTPEVA
jgi:O-antigen/teichoic acid export membrane protein